MRDHLIVFYSWLSDYINYFFPDALNFLFFQILHKEILIYSAAMLFIFFFSAKIFNSFKAYSSDLSISKVLITTKTIIDTIITPQKVHVNPKVLPIIVTVTKSPNPTVVIVIKTNQTQF